MVDEDLAAEYAAALESHDPERIKELAKQVDEQRTAERIAEGRSTEANVGTGGTGAEGTEPDVATDGQEG
jgi:hypothetical protein